MKLIHKNIGEVELVGELGKGDNEGRTKVKLKDGSEVLATTVYLKPLPKADDAARTNTGAK